MARASLASTLTLYHGTSAANAESIRHKGLKASDTMGYDRPNWYMLADNPGDAEAHAGGYAESPEDQRIVTVEIPIEQQKTYLWPQSPQGWYALRAPLPAEFIKSVHPAVLTKKAMAHRAMPMPTQLPEGWTLQFEPKNWRTASSWLRQPGAPLGVVIYNNQGRIVADILAERARANRWQVVSARGDHGWGAFAYEQLLKVVSELGGYLSSDTVVSDAAAKVWDKYFARNDVEKIPHTREVMRNPDDDELSSSFKNVKIRKEPSLQHAYRLLLSAPAQAQTQLQTPVSPQAKASAFKPMIDAGRADLSKPDGMTNEQLVELVREHLDPKTLKKKWRDAIEFEGAHPHTGHSYSATEALYHLMGGRKSGWAPHLIRHEGHQHWYLRHTESGEVLDAANGHLAIKPDYAAGSTRGFMTGDVPSQKAYDLIRKVRRAKRSLTHTAGPLDPDKFDLHREELDVQPNKQEWPLNEPKREGVPIQTLTPNTTRSSDVGLANILKVYDAATVSEQDFWGKWYYEAQTDVEILAAHYGLPFETVAAIVAVLSPGNKWAQNLNAADAFLSGAEKVSSYPANIAKCRKILNAPVDKLLQFVTGPKVVVFFQSLLDPETVKNKLTLDGHAINIWRGDRRPLKGTPRPTKTERAQMLADYAEAARQRGVSTQAMQAVTWYVWKYAGGGGEYRNAGDKTRLPLGGMVHVAGRQERIDALKVKFPDRNVDELAALDPTGNGSYVEWIVERIPTANPTVKQLLTQYDEFKRKKLLDPASADIKRLDLAGVQKAVAAGQEKLEQREHDNFIEQRAKLVARNMQQLHDAEEARKQSQEAKSVAEEQFTEGPFTFKLLKTQEEIAKVSPGNWCVGWLNSPSHYKTYSAEPNPRFYFITSSEPDNRAPWLLFLSGGPHNGECRDRNDQTVANPKLVETIQNKFGVRVLSGYQADAEIGAETIRDSKDPMAIAIAAHSRSDMVLSAIAQNPISPPRILASLARHPQLQVRQHVAGNYNTPTETLQQLLPEAQRLATTHTPGWGNLTNDTLLANITANENATPEMLAAIADTPNLPPQNTLSLFSVLARNKNTPVEILRRITNTAVADTSHSHERIRDRLARNPALPQDSLLALADYSLKTGQVTGPIRIIVHRKDCPREVFEKCLPYNSTALLAAQSSQTPADILAKLAKDKREVIREAALRNRNTPQEVLRDVHRDIESVVTADQKDLSPNQKQRLIDGSVSAILKSPNAPPELLEQYKHDYLEAVAANPSTPQSVLVELTNEALTSPVIGPFRRRSQDVLRLLLENPSLPESIHSQITKYALNTDDYILLNAVAESEAIRPQDLVLIFNKVGQNLSTLVGLEVLTNPNFPATEFQKAVLQLRPFHYMSIMQSIAERKDLSPEFLTTLARVPIRAARQTAFQNPRTPREVRVWLFQHNFDPYPTPEHLAQMAAAQAAQPGQQVQASARVSLPLGKQAAYAEGADRQNQLENVRKIYELEYKLSQLKRFDGPLPQKAYQLQPQWQGELSKRLDSALDYLKHVADHWIETHVPPMTYDDIHQQLAERGMVYQTDNQMRLGRVRIISDKRQQIVDNLIDVLDDINTWDYVDRDSYPKGEEGEEEFQEACDEFDDNLSDVKHRLELNPNSLWAYLGQKLVLFHRVLTTTHNNGPLASRAYGARAVDELAALSNMAVPTRWDADVRNLLNMPRGAAEAPRVRAARLSLGKQALLRDGSVSGASMIVVARAPKYLADVWPMGREGHDSSPPHVTVLYVGDNGEDESGAAKPHTPQTIAKLVELVQDAARTTSAFDMRMKPGVSWFENDKGECIAHKAFIPESQAKLAELHEKLYNGLKAASIEPKHFKKDGFTAHATLAYCFERVWDKELGEVPEGIWPVEELEIWGLDDEGDPKRWVYKLDGDGEDDDTLFDVAAALDDAIADMVKQADVFHGTMGGFVELDHDRSGLGTHFGSWDAADQRLRRPTKEWAGYQPEYDECFDCDGTGLDQVGGQCDKCNGEGQIKLEDSDEYQDELPQEAEIRHYDIQVENPLRMSDVGTWNEVSAVADELRRLGMFGDNYNEAYALYQRLRSLPEPQAWAEMRKIIEDAGYDSVVYKNAVEDLHSDSYIVWDSRRIKLIKQHTPENPKPYGYLRNNAPHRRGARLTLGRKAASQNETKFEYKITPVDPTDRFYQKHRFSMQTEGGKELGFLTFYPPTSPYKKGQLEIGLVKMNEDARGRGLGTQLMAAFKKYARKQWPWIKTVFGEPTSQGSYRFMQRTLGEPVYVDNGIRQFAPEERADLVSRLPPSAQFDEYGNVEGSSAPRVEWSLTKHTKKKAAISPEQMQTSRGLAAEYRKFFDATKAKFDKMVAAGEPEAVTGMWMHEHLDLFWAGRKWVDSLLRTRQIPNGKHKAVEMAARLFSAKKSPREGFPWFAKNEPRLRLLYDAADWPERVEAPLETKVPLGTLPDANGNLPPQTQGQAFKVGPFTVHNTIGATGKLLQDTVAIVQHALSKLGQVPLPGFDKMAYGELYIVGRLLGHNTVAWYDPTKDEVFLRPLARGTTVTSSAGYLIHELGHRYWKKVMTQAQRNAWIKYDIQVRSAIERAPLPVFEVGQRIENLNVNGKPFAFGGYEGGSVIVLNADDGTRIGKIDRLKFASWAREARMRTEFTSAYALKNHEEHFCEALRVIVDGTAKPELAAALTQSMAS